MNKDSSSARPDGKLVRLVPMTKRQRDGLQAAMRNLQMDGHRWATKQVLTAVEAWDAAPADPAEAVTNVLSVLDGYPTAWENDEDIWPALVRDARAICKALGVPDANQEPSDA